MAAIGEVIDDKYEILKLIGRGGMSRVYLAMDKRLNKQWAVKEIEKRARDKNNEVVIQSAIAEANMIKKLDHPALPRIVDIIDNGDVICVVMDYIEGEPLSRILDNEGAQPEEAVIEWAKQLCEVLDYLHTRTPPIIYRDMKPANIMLKPDGTVKLIDFGIAREYKEHNVADTMNMGTKGYAAPEQFGNAGQTDARTDVYCLGVTLYHLITGHNPAEPPYEIYPIRHWNPQLSAGLEAIIQKCVQANPNDRYQSCAELMYALQHYEEYGAEYKAAQRKKLVSFIAAAAASVVCLGLGFMSLGIRTHVNNTDFDNQLELAKNQNNPEQKLEHLIEANSLKPLDFRPYEEMIELFKSPDEDDELKFTHEEEAALKRCLDMNLKDLRKQPNYADLAYKLGTLYWNYYDFGGNNNDLTRMTSAEPWFKDAVTYSDESYEYHKIAEVYQSIGEFKSSIGKELKESNNIDGMYSDYWNDLKSLLEKVSPKDGPMVQLEAYNLIMNEIAVNATWFKNDGVEKDDMQKVYDKVLERVDEIDDTGVSTIDDLKAQIIKTSKGKQGAQEAIKRAYKQTVKEEE